MPDFSIDYQLLEQVQNKMRQLARTADSGGTAGTFKGIGDSSANTEIRSIFGSQDLTSAMVSFSRRSNVSTEEAKRGLEKLADVFETVSDNYFQVDAMMAGSAGLMGSSLGLDEWQQDRAEWAAWDADAKEWEEFLKKIGADGYFEEHPDADINKVCSAEGAPGWCETYNKLEDVPGAPGPAPDDPRPSDVPPTEYTVETDTGSTHVKVTLDDEYNVMKEESTIRTGDQTYKSVTTYDTPPQVIRPTGGDPFDARDYTTVTTYPDGSESTARYVIGDDGKGTMTVTDKDGTKEYTRGGPGAEWEEEN